MPKVTFNKQKTDQKSINKTKAFYYALIENSNEAISLLDENFVTVYSSPYAERITGWNTEERIKIGGVEHTHPDDRGKMKGVMQQVRTHPGKPFFISFRTKHKSGHYLWMEGMITNMLHDKSVKGIVCNLRDVSENKKSEENSQARLKEISDYKYALEESSIVAVTDEKGIIKYANHNFSKISKYSVDELTGDAHHIIHSEYHPEEYIRNLWETVSGGKIWRGELKNKAKDGSVYWVDTSIVPILNNQSKPDQYVVIRTDITERKFAETELQASYEKLFFHIENTPLGFIEWDNQLHIKSLSGKAEEIFSWSERELTDNKKGLLTLVYEDDLPKLRSMAEQLSSGKAERINIQFRNYTKDGRVIWCEWFSSVMKNKDGKVIIMSLVQDITERKEAEQEIIKLNGELRQLAAYLQSIREEERAHIAHEIHDELGQLLTALKMDLSWIDKKFPDNDAVIKEKISGMLELVDETVKTVKRISSELRPGILDDLGLAAALEWQSHDFEKRTGIKCIFTTDFPDETIEKSIATGFFRIHQETLTNIARHSHATKVTSVFSHSQDNMVLLITDNGIGFDTEKTKSKMTFGIVGMKERALMMKGDLTVNAMSGKGTSIMLKVPLSLSSGS